jgi:hypothetical protein
LWITWQNADEYGGYVMFFGSFLPLCQSFRPFFLFFFSSFLGVRKAANSNVLSAVFSAESAAKLGRKFGKFGVKSTANLGLFSPFAAWAQRSKWPKYLWISRRTLDPRELAALKSPRNSCGYSAFFAAGM